MAQSKLLKEVNFITQPSQDFSCPVCLSILQEPFLTICCGGHFCEACVQKVKEQHNECPLCKESPLNAVIDKYFKRQLNQLVVYCSQKECKWTGELGKVNKHLAIGQPAGDCQYVNVKCPLSCGQQILRKLLHSHTTDDCPYRSASCQYCDFKGSHLVVTTKHKDICPNYPCTCPNSCSLGIITRHNMSDHLAQCPELEMGCAKVMRRKQLQEHLETSNVEHQMLTCKAFSTLQLEVQAMQQQHQLEIAAIREELESKAGQAEYWVNGFKLMAEEVEKNNWNVYLSRMSELVSSMSPAVTPVIIGLPNITVSDHLKRSHSAPFYAHPQGYKMLLYAKYDHCEIGGWISYQNQANIKASLCVVKGEYDESLKWPLQGRATILLLNSQQDDKHREAVYNFTAARYADDHPVHSTIDKPTRYADDESVHSTIDKLTRYGDESVHLQYDKSTQRPKCARKQTPHKSGRKIRASKLFMASELGPFHPHHNHCKPVESAESVKFSFDKNDYNNDAGMYFKGDHIYFKVTIEITNAFSM